jgi:coenzyme F420-0:L-glutamate ligase / coenzyme F420-1:gamma-L-glutamate ligase
MSNQLNVSDLEAHRRQSPTSVQIIPLTGLPEISANADLPQLILEAINRQKLVLDQGDVVALAQKIVSKAEGQFVRLNSIEPSERAKQWASEFGKDPRVIELVFRESQRIVRMERGVIVAQTRHGFVCANAGVDVSNVPDGIALLLPKDPDRSAHILHERLCAALGIDVAVIVSDTFGRPWREGLVNVALGVAGMAPLIDYRGERDEQGRVLQATVIALADELAAAAGIVMGKLNRVPVVVIQGLAVPRGAGSGRDLIRSPERDLFR